MSMSGGRFDFADGGTYCGGWEDGKAHGQGICTGPNGQGEYAGSWNHGFEVLGMYTWPSGNTYEGNWLNGKRHNHGVETKGKWKYKGEWSHGLKGRYGVRGNTTGQAKYEGTWSNGLQDGYGTETYADGGTYQGQWAGGMRHGAGIRQSMPYGMASVVKSPLRNSMSSLRSDPSSGNISSTDLPPEAPIGSRGGFVLTLQPSVTSQSALPARKSRLFRSDSTSLRKSVLGGLLRSKSNTSIASEASRYSHRSTKSYRSDVTASSLTSDYQSIYGSASERTDTVSHLEAIEDEIDVNTSETYHGEWKNDSRTGYGVCQRTDGFTYEGEWLDNQRHGYGCTTFPDSTKEEGKYRNNTIVTGPRRSSLLAIKSGKIKSKVAHAVTRARKAKETAEQKADIASSRTAHSLVKAKQAEVAAQTAREEAKVARCVARDLAPDFYQPGLQHMKQRGDDPFKELDTVDSSYLADRDRNDVAGPESYHQFSAHALSASPVASRSGSVDANAMNVVELGRSSKMQSSGMINAQQRNNTISKQSTPFSRSADETSNASPQTVPAQPKMKYLSPSSALHVSYEPHVPNSTEKTKGDTPVAEKSPAKAPRQSFFKSLRTRHKKSRSDAAAVAATEPNTDWRRNSAEEKRKMWQKSMSSSERATGNSLSRSLCESFDYESKQAEYLSGYEAEMTQAGNASVFMDDDVRIDGRTRSLQNVDSYSSGPNRSASSGYLERFGSALLRHTDDTRNCYGDPVSNNPNNESYAGYPSSSNLSYPAGSAGYHSASSAGYSESRSLTNSLPRNSSHAALGAGMRNPQSVDHTKSRGHAGAGYSGSNTATNSSPSLSMSALRPRDANSEKWRDVPAQCAPAFANFPRPASGDSTAEHAQKMLARAVSDKLRRQQSISLTGSQPDVEEGLSRDSVLLDEDSKSPLPGNLRRRHDASQLEEDSAAPVAKETDPTRTCMIILVVLLNVGFFALFVQFLT